jgi:hypothetical protein
MDCLHFINMNLATYRYLQNCWDYEDHRQQPHKRIVRNKIFIHDPMEFIIMADDKAKGFEHRLCDPRGSAEELSWQLYGSKSAKRKPDAKNQ